MTLLSKKGTFKIEKTAPTQFFESVKHTFRQNKRLINGVGKSLQFSGAKKNDEGEKGRVWKPGKGSRHDFQTFDTVNHA